ncbi:MAG: hypothetical protein JO156_09735, partial [Solirubrobacterales bacterium]|nr:hypothetical protein [Solirubrobacterales bacterium]
MLSASGALRRLAGKEIWLWALIPLAIAILSWQPVGLEPGPSGDASWGAGLELALRGGISFGNQAVFTYGPLGFLSVNPLWFFHLGELSFAYLVVVRVGLAAALLAGARRTFGGLTAFVLAAVVAAVDEQLPELTIALIVTVLLATSPVRRRRSVVVLGALGAFAALEVLNKVSYGVGIGTMTVVLALTLPGRRREYLTATAAGFVVAFALLWAVLGQDFAALPDFIRNSAQ